MKKIFVSIVLSFIILTLSACSKNVETDEITTIYISHILDESTENTAHAREWLRNELEEYLGIKVVHLEEVSHLIGIEAMRAGHLDIMFASAFTTVNAQEVVDIEIAGTLNHSQVNPLNTLFITNNDEIQSLADLRGHSFAFVNPTSASGFFFPAFQLIQDFDLDGELITFDNHFFSTTVFSGSQDASISGVSTGDFDAAAVLSTVYRGVISSGVIDPDSVRIIGQTNPSPDSSYIMRADLPVDLKLSIRSFFLNLDNSDYFLNAWGFEDLRFIEGNYEELDQVRTMMQVLGIEN